VDGKSARPLGERCSKFAVSRLFVLLYRTHPPSSSSRGRSLALVTSSRELNEKLILHLAAVQVNFTVRDDRYKFRREACKQFPEVWRLRLIIR
jgi:hypothetical protein